MRIPAASCWQPRTGGNPGERVWPLSAAPWRASRRAEPDVLIVFPIHRNPVVRKAILPACEGIDNIRVVEPLAYGGFARLMERASILVTDSGGIQEEGPSLGKPVLVMRETTERPEAVEAGTVRLVGTNQNLITKSVLELLRDPDAYEVMANAVNPYGDGQATRRTTAASPTLLRRWAPPRRIRRLRRRECHSVTARIQSGVTARVSGPTRAVASGARARSPRGCQGEASHPRRPRTSA